MWTKHFPLLPIFLLHTMASTEARCNKDRWIFLCESNRITVGDAKEMKPIRMPLTSEDCDRAGAEATCESDLSAKFGEKILVKTSVVFELGEKTSPCLNNRHVSLSSKSDTVSKTDKKCGSITPGTDIFQSVNEKMTVKYTSNSIDDGVVIDVEAYGCAKEEFSAPNSGTTLELTYMDFKPDDVQYEGLVRCVEGYLMPGNVSSKAIACRSKIVQIGREWSWDPVSDDATCNRMTCIEPSLPVNGRLEALSNGYFHDSQATFACGLGYFLEGDNTRSCVVESGIGAYWSGTTPVCKMVDCGSPLMIHNSSFIMPSMNTYQSMFTYTCDPGFTPSSGQAICTANGTWIFDECKAIVCTSPSAQPDWLRMTPDNGSWVVGSSVSYYCKHDESKGLIVCESNGDSRLGTWTKLGKCRKPTSIRPIERISLPPRRDQQKEAADTGAIIGGIIAGLIVALIVLILACIFIRRSKSRKRSSKNNNNDEEMKKLREPLNSLSPADITKLDSIKTNGNGDIERQPPTELAPSVKHFYNRGNNRPRNGLNGTATRNSEKISESASSIEPLETGDLFDSVMNGTITVSEMNGKRSTTPSERKSTASIDRKSTESSERRNAHSSKRKSADSTDRRSNASNGRKSVGSFEGTPRGSMDRRSRGSIDRKHAPTCPKARLENGGERINL
ncbi:uncharacterized protein [Watersipora subatra]|uniref:uncharacterized protein isoform X2 n=1 Tax=Watersipora subatra TaxID=2589382 RepID=UPI00355B991B